MNNYQIAKQAITAAAQCPDRRPLLEEKIAKSLTCSLWYADNVLGGDFYLRGVRIIAAGLEGRIEFVKKTFGPKLELALKNDHSARLKHISDVDGLIKLLAEKFDPTHNKAYLAGLAKRYTTKQFLVEDAEKVWGGLKVFDKFKHKMEIRDFNKFKDMDEFWTTIEPFEDQKTGKEAIKEIKGDADVFLETSNLKVVIPKSEAASCMYGSGTKWCTAADESNQFENYSGKGPLYILMFKSLAGKPRKFQLHYETESFMNEKDSNVSQTEIAQMSKDEGYTQFLNKLIKMHYSDIIEENKRDLAALRAKKKTAALQIVIE